MRWPCTAMRITAPTTTCALRAHSCIPGTLCIFSHFGISFAHLPLDQFYYIVSPKDVVIAKPRTLDDHVKWLHSRGRLADALAMAKGRERELVHADLGEITHEYILKLVNSGAYDDAAKQCSRLLGTDVVRWEQWIFTFSKRGQLPAISPFIPIDKPRLTPTVYEMVLDNFLNTNVPVSPQPSACVSLCVCVCVCGAHVRVCARRQRFQQTIREWPSSLYDIENIIPAVVARLSANADDGMLCETLAELCVVCLLCGGLGSVSRKAASHNWPRLGVQIYCAKAV